MKLSKVELMMTRFLWLKNSRVCDMTRVILKCVKDLYEEWGKIAQMQIVFVMAM